MASLSEHESGKTRGAGRPVFVRLLRYAKPYIPLIAITLLLSLGFSTGRFARAYLMKPLIDDVIVPHGASMAEVGPSEFIPDFGLFGGEKREPAAEPLLLDDEQKADLREQVRGNFLNIIGIAIVIVFAMPLLQFGRSYIIEYAMGRIFVDIKQDVCAKLLALPLSFHHNRRRGDVLSRTMADVGSAHSALALVFGELVQQVMMIAVGVTGLLFLSWQLALCSLVIGPMIFGVVSVFGVRIRNAARKRQEKFADVTQQMLEILSGIKVIKAFRAEAIEHAAYRRQTDKLFRRSMKVVKNRVLARSSTEMLNTAMALGMLILGTWLLLGGRWGLTLGSLSAFAAVLSATYRPIKGLARAWVKLMDSQPAAERFFEVMDSPVEIRDSPDAVSLGALKRGVRFDGVSFSYGRESVLEGVSLEVKAGEVVAIVGRTGAGKTTLIDLLLRFYDPTAGRIEFDGVDLRKIKRDSLFQMIAVVSQEPFLFDGTIRENLCYGRPEATEDEILAAAEAAHVHEFASQLPDGYETEVGTVGARLSGGQRQRITIARAILKNPAILVFDEATSSLDSKSERYVQDAIDALLGGGRTVFVIAHRLSTSRRADKIVVLENGTISQIGTHDELMHEPGLYRELIELQTTPTPGLPPEIRPN